MSGGFGSLDHIVPHADKKVPLLNNSNQSNQQMASTNGKHGGARPGAGRKRTPPILCDSLGLLTADPESFLRAVMNESTLPTRIRVDVAKTLLGRASPTLPS